MEGVDIHVDVNVGKQLSALGHTLTMLTGAELDDDTATVDTDSDETDHTDGIRASEVRPRPLPSFASHQTFASFRRNVMSLQGLQNSTF